MKINYILSFPAPHTHYVEVEMHISDIVNNNLQLKMAVWTPGSYLIREFQKNIDFVEYKAENNIWKRLEKSDKNTWLLNVENRNEITLRYAVYSFEYSVRTNFVDTTHALINGASTFLYIDGAEDTALNINIHPFDEWQQISTALSQAGDNKWQRTAANIDELIDSPIEIGNHTSYFFQAASIQHELAIYGESNIEVEKIIEDFKKIIEEEVKIFGSHPCEKYVFIIHHTDSSYGGLEHLNSSVNHITRWSYDKENYQRSISLLAHEYFHLWNVKRIRPSSLIPYNYNTENYTDLLWFFEGITSYYDDYVCYRAGVTPLDSFLKIIEKNINDVINNTGFNVQTLSESSFDTWLKYYRRNENSINAHVNYYTQGALIAMLIDLSIIHASNGQKSLDDVMRTLYDAYLKQNYKGITEDDIILAIDSVCPINSKNLLDQYLRSTTPIHVIDFFENIGIEANEKSDENVIYLGLGFSWKENKLMITQVDKQYGASIGGLSAEDEIIAIDGFRVNKNYKNIYAHKKVNDTIEVTIARQGILKTLQVPLTADRFKKITLQKLSNPNESQQIKLEKWLGKN